MITTTNQKIVESRDRRFSKDMVVAMSCEITKVDDRGTYKTQSEIDVNKYCIVKFMDGTPVFCSCKVFEIQIKRRGNEKHLCKHMRAIGLAENYGLVTQQQISYSPTQAITRKQEPTESKSSYKDDDYSF